MENLKNSNIWAGTTGKSYTFEYGELIECDPITYQGIGTHIVSEVDTENKTITIDEVTTIEALKKAAETATYTQEEKALGTFLYLLPNVKKFMSKMGGNAIERVVFALAEFPLHEGKPKLKGKDEEDLFNLLQEITAAKAIILRYALEEQKNKAVSTAEEGKEDVTNEN